MPAPALNEKTAEAVIGSYGLDPAVQEARANYLHYRMVRKSDNKVFHVQIAPNEVKVLEDGQVKHSAGFPDWIKGLSTVLQKVK